MQLTPETAWLVIGHESHGLTAVERARHGVQSQRMLNITGRWSTRPTAEVPVLVWVDARAAERAVQICKQHRRGEIAVRSFAGSGLEVGKQLVLFAPSLAAALRGYLDYKPIAAAKAEEARLKTLACAGYLVGQATSDERLLAAARGLAPRAVSGAVDFLVGRTGSAIALEIVAGRLPAHEVITPAVVSGGRRLAQLAMQVRLAGQR